MEARSESKGRPAPDRQGSSAFSVRLKQLRVLRGFRTARAFAQALEIDENRYTRWERGEVEPSVAMLAKMAEVLNIPVDVLVSGGDVAAALPATAGAREGGIGASRASTLPGRSETTGLHEDATHFGLDRSPEELSQKVLLASRAYLMSLLERRVAAMGQADIDALISKLAGQPPGPSLGGLENAIGGKSRAD